MAKFHITMHRNGKAFFVFFPGKSKGTYLEIEEFWSLRRGEAGVAVSLFLQAEGFEDPTTRNDD